MRRRGTLSRWGELARPAEGRLLGGVCAAIAERLVLDVWLVRLAFVVLALADGIGVVFYLLGWLLLPPEGERLRGTGWRGVAASRLSVLGTELSRVGAAARDAWGRGARSPWPRPLSRRWIGLALVAGGTLVLLASFGAFEWLTPVRALGLAMGAAGAGVLVAVQRG